MSENGLWFCSATFYWRITAEMWIISIHTVLRFLQAFFTDLSCFFSLLVSDTMIFHWSHSLLSLKPSFPEVHGRCPIRLIQWRSGMLFCIAATKEYFTGKQDSVSLKILWDKSRRVGKNELHRRHDRESLTSRDSQNNYILSFTHLQMRLLKSTRVLR